MRSAYYLRKIPSSDDSANILELLNTFLCILLNKNYYNLGKLGPLTVWPPSLRNSLFFL
jgi:hypothetical protein